MTIRDQRQGTRTKHQVKGTWPLRLGIHLAPQLLRRLRAMAHIQSRSISHLAAEYIERGLAADSERIDNDPQWLDRM